MHNLTPDQLAEGARLLEAVTIEHYGLIICPNEPVSAAVKWLLGNCTELMSAAHRVAEVEGCVREIASRLDQCANDCLERSREDTPIAHGAGLGALAYGIARSEVVKIAARHNIDLSEPTQKEASCS